MPIKRKSLSQMCWRVVSGSTAAVSLLGYNNVQYATPMVMQAIAVITN